MSRTVPPHALLVAFWGVREKDGGAAVLSVPTREYLQSSGWVRADEFTEKKQQERTTAQPDLRARASHPDMSAVESVRSGSDFWAGGHHGSGSESLSAYTYTGMSLIAGSVDMSGNGSREYSNGQQRRRNFNSCADTEDARFEGQTGNDGDNAGDDSNEDESESQEAYEAFMAGMIYALSRRLLPGDPYTPFAVHGSNRERSDSNQSGDRDLWRLDECLRSVLIYCCVAMFVDEPLQSHLSHLRHVDSQVNSLVGQYRERRSLVSSVHPVSGLLISIPIRTFATTE